MTYIAYALDPPRRRIVAPYRAMLLAHPLTEAAELGVAPAFVGALAAALVLLAAWVGRARAASQAAEPLPVVRDLAGRLALPLTPRQVVGRVLGVSLLGLAVTAGRFGDPGQIDNIATGLVIGLGWPALLLVTALLGGVWSWINPYDALARPLELTAGRGLNPADGAPGVPAADDANGSADTGDADAAWGAVTVVTAVGWTWWLALWQPGLQPRAIGMGLGLYTLLVLAGCLAVGRAAWLARAELVTVLLGALSRSRRSVIALDRWHAIALAVLLGGLASAEIRFSRWYLADVEAIGLLPFSEPASVLAHVVLVGLGVVTVMGARRWADRARTSRAVDTVLPWLIAGFGLSAAVERDRLWTSAQVVIARASNPFGGDGDLLGTADMVVRPWPYSDITRLVVQLVLLVLPVVIGALVVARRTGRSAGRPDAAIALAVGWVLIGALSAATL